MYSKNLPEALWTPFLLPSAHSQCPSSIWASLRVQLVKNLAAMQETLVRFLGSEDPLEKGKATHSSILGLPLWLSWYKSPTMREIWVQSLGWEDPLQKGTATHSSILAWRIPWTV